MIWRRKKSQKKKKLAINKKINSQDNDGFIPDYTPKNMDIMIVGFNPGIKSGVVGHHYAGRNNHFYDLLYLSQLTPRKLHYSEDHLLPNYGIGLTNIIARSTRGSSDLSKDEMKEGAKVLIQKLKECSPKVVCFNGMAIFEACSHKKCKVGLQQAGSIPELTMPLFVVPSSSARVSGYQKADKATFWKELKNILDGVKQNEE